MMHSQTAAFVGLCALILICPYCFALEPSVLTYPTTPDTLDVCQMSFKVSTDEEKTIKCTCNGVHMDADCSNREIGDLPNLISFPKNIHVATFSGNKISNLNKDTFYNGRDVVELDLSYNQIDFVSTLAFNAFKNLKKLDLSHNRIWNVPNTAFAGISDLRRLDLSYNDLSNVFPELFQELTELRELILKANPLQELEPKHFAHLNKLELLNLDLTILKVIPDHVFVFTPKLKFLGLADNQLTEVPTEALQVLDHVKVLDLSGNLIDKITPEAFKGLRGLVILYLDRMPKLEKIEKFAFGDMVQLQELHCSYNFKLSEIDENAFVRKIDNQKVPLVQLFLRQDDITHVPKSLLDWNSAVELHLMDNPLHCDCNTQWMVTTKLKNDFQSHIRCATPDEYAGMTLAELKSHDLTCGLHLSEIVMIVCATIAALLIVVMIVAFLVWRRNYRGYSKPYFHNSQKHHKNEIDYTGGIDDGL